MPESLLAQWFRRVWNENDLTAVHELASPDFVSHGLGGTIRGFEPWLSQFHAGVSQAFTGIRIELLEEVSQGDRVFGRLRATQTPRVTGKPISIHGSCLMRVQDGKIVEAWDCWDFLSLLEGMGCLPPGSFGLAVSGRLPRHPLT